MYKSNRNEFIARLAALVCGSMAVAVLAAGCSSGGSSSGSNDVSSYSSDRMDSSGMTSSAASAETDSDVSDASSETVSDAPIDVIREKDLMIGGIALNITQEEFRLVMTGEPVETRVVKDDYLDFTETTYIYDGIEVLFVDDACYSVVVTGGGYATPRGLTVGDSQDKVLHLYGEPAARNESHWGYNYEGGADFEVFSVTITDGKVSEIRVNLAL